MFVTGWDSYISLGEGQSRRRERGCALDFLYTFTLPHVPLKQSLCGPDHQTMTPRFPAEFCSCSCCLLNRYRKSLWWILICWQLYISIEWIFHSTSRWCDPREKSFPYLLSFPWLRLWMMRLDITISKIEERLLILMARKWVRASENITVTFTLQSWQTSH